MQVEDYAVHAATSTNHVFAVKHNLVLKNGELFDCSEENCGWRGRSQTSLGIHMGKHRGLRNKARMNRSRNFICDMCGAGFAKKFKLREQINCVHLGKKRERRFIKPAYCKCGFFMVDGNSRRRHGRVCVDYGIAK
jgi:hypothetical protein